MNISFIIKYIIKIFIIVDPIGMFPIILDQVVKSSPSYEGRKSFIRRELIIASIISLTTLFLGRTIFYILDIPIKIVRIAGGILLTIIGLNMSNITLETLESEEDTLTEDKSIIFPVATPIIAGPGTMSLIMIMRESAPSFIDAFITTVIGVFICIAIIYLLFLVSSKLSNAVLKTASFFAAIITIIFGVYMIGEGLLS
ncbi:MAG: MarC family protein [Chlamydiia bacterium]|nr:MarC family protein [Chlamydiia bacterium]